MTSQQCAKSQKLLCQPTTHDWKPKLKQIPLLYYPNAEEMLIFGKERFSLTIFWNYFITKEDEESCLWLPAALGWLFLAKGSRVESFHKGSTLCCAKENWIMSSWDPVHERPIYASIASKYFISRFSAPSELTGVWAKGIRIKTACYSVL